MTLTRRKFLQGLVTAAVVAAVPLPAAAVEEIAAPVAAAGNTLIPPDLVAKEALEAFRLNRKFLSFRKDYNIVNDAMCYIADYHVPAHEKPAKAEVEGIPLGDPRMDETFTVTVEYVPEVHYRQFVELPPDYRDMLPELEEMMAAEIERALAA